jgi:MoaA/NifB/PqqE/SkfB family radical SAM enzyme
LKHRQFPLEWTRVDWEATRPIWGYVRFMKWTALPRKIVRGLPYLNKELRTVVSDRTAFFIAKPRTVHIWRGQPCNGHCIMCTLGFFTPEKRKEACTSEFTDDMVARSLLQIGELCGRGTMVSYMGGEPTLNPHLLDWVRIAGDAGLDFRFTTNGYRMTPELAAKLVSAGLFNIGVSLESLDPKINETMRPHPHGTELTVRAIELLLGERRRQRARLSVNVKTVVSNINMHSFIEIAERWGREDGVLVTPQTFEAQEGMPQATRDLLFIKDIKRLEEFAERVRELKRAGCNIHITDQGLDEFVKFYREDAGHESTMGQKKVEMDPSAPPCNIGTDSLFIHEGLVRLCPYHAPIGNLITGTETLKEIWDGEVCSRVRKQTRACRRLCNISCLRRTPLMHKVKTFLRAA